MATPTASPEVLVNGDTSHDQDSEIIRLADGRSLVIWTRDPPGLGQTAHGQLFDSSGSKVGEAFQFGATDDVGVIIASATAAPDGGFLLAWNEAVGSGFMDVHLARYNGAGLQLASTQLTLPGQQYAASVDALQGGGFALTYSTNNAARNESLMLQRLDDAGAPTGAPTTVFAGVTLNDHDYGAALAEVAQLSNGDILVAFVMNDYSRTTQTGGDDILVQRLTAQGTKVGEPIVVDRHSAASEYARDPVITATADGGFAVAWIRRSPTGMEAEVRKFFADGTVSGATSYAMDSNIGRHGVDVDALPDGGFVLSYATASGVDVALQMFNSSGAAQGEPFIVNSFRTGEQVAPDATWLADGTLGVTWNSLGQDGPRAAVYVSKVTGLYEPGSGRVIDSPGPGSSLRGSEGADTLNASQGADTLTGGGGEDVFAYKALPWNAGRITDFSVGADRLDLSAILSASGYSGADPIADGRVTLDSDGAGGTRIFFDRDAPNSGDWPFLITTLENVGPTGLTWAQLSGESVDTQPVAAHDSDTVVLGSSVPATGNVITDASPGDEGDADQGADSAGANGPLSIVAIRTTHTADTEPDSSGNFVQIGRFGTLTINVSGAYSYTLTSSPEAGVTDVFGYQVKDADGDIAVASLGIQVLGSGPSGEVLTWDQHGDTLTGGAGADTLNASQGPDVLTGGAGDDAFVYQAMPWNAGQITDFAVGSDRLDLSKIFEANGYVGSDPVADGKMRLDSDGAGGTRVYFDRDAPDGGDWPFLVTTLQNVSPTGLTWSRLSGQLAPEQGRVINSPGPGSTLQGGAGADTLNASRGPDHLAGGAAADHFVFAEAPWSAGVITDFTPSLDTIDISGLLDAYTGSNPIADGWLRLDNASGSTAVYVDIDGAGGEWPFLITTLQGVGPSSVGLGDFIV